MGSKLKFRIAFAVMAFIFAELINFLLYGVNKTAELVSSILLVMAILYGIIEFLVYYRGKLESSSGNNTDPDTQARSDSSIEAGNSSPANSFRRTGDAWEIVYNGSKPATVKDTIGMKQLSVLLLQPGHWFEATESITREHHMAASIKNPAKDAEAPDEYSDISVTKTDVVKTPVDVADQQSIAEALDLRKEFQERCNATTDQIETEELLNKIKQIDDWLGKVEAKGGRPRLTATDQKNAIDALRGTIKTARKNIKLQNSLLASHLKKSISFKEGNISYSPAFTTIWKKS